MTRHAAHRHHRRRHDPRQCRLSGVARAGGPGRRHTERGFCGREHGRRRFPARQSQLSDPAGRAWHRQGRRCAWPVAYLAILAGRGAGAQRRAVGGVSRLRALIASGIRRDRSAGGARPAPGGRVGDAAADQLIEYLAAGQAALGTVPTQETIVLERFFDEAGGMQLVIHSPYGSRINRAWDWRFASASAASSISSCRLRRPKTISSSPSPRLTASI